MDTKTLAKEFVQENNIVAASNPIDWDGDTSFGYCSVAELSGSLEPMTFLCADGTEFEQDLLDGIAYAIHGIFGAY
jgi:hypothetical protein